MSNEWKLLRMLCQRDVRILLRYKLNFVMQVVNTLLFVLGALIFFDLVGQTTMLETVGAKNYISYMLVGVAVGGYVNVALFGSSNAITGELISGQIEYIFSCPVSRYKYIAASALAQVFVATFTFVPLMLLAVSYAGTFSLTGLLLGVGIIIAQLAVLVQLGVVFAGLALVYKQISAAFGVVSMIFLLFSGTFFPLQVLPQSAQSLALAVPTTTGLDLLRHYLLGTLTLVPTGWELTAILAEFLVLAALAMALTRRLEDSWKRDGLSHI